MDSFEPESARSYMLHPTSSRLETRQALASWFNTNVHTMPLPIYSVGKSAVIIKFPWKRELIRTATSLKWTQNIGFYNTRLSQTVVPCLLHSVTKTCHCTNSNTVQILCIGTDRSQQTEQTKIRLLLQKQSDQGLRCLPFHQHLLDALMQCYIKLFYF